MLQLGKPEGGANADGGTPLRIAPLRRTSRLGKPEGDGRVVQGMRGEAAR